MAGLEKRALGRTGLEVTALGFGAMELRGAGRRWARPLPAGQAGRVLNAVLDAGINFIDTSIDYGESEDLIGQWVSHRRDEYFLASKAGCPWDEQTLASAPAGPLPHDFSPTHIREGLERSLRLLRTDHLDLLQLHMSPSLETIKAAQALETLTALRDEGKVRFIGSSSTAPHIWDLVATGAFDAFQVPYSALERDHEEAITQAHQAGAGVIVRGGVARGGFRPGTIVTRNLWEAWDTANLDELLDEGQRRVEFVLRYTLSHPEVSTIIVGTANEEHLRDNVAGALRGPLPSDLYEEARRRLDAAGVTALAPTAP
ncbi:MAG TPA: aldo/keto reductase [Streptosporangiaceae bacterium]|nr:aldo/keto reductase [Streptosporangiaceae bacterium]